MRQSISATALALVLLAAGIPAGAQYGDGGFGGSGLGGFGADFGGDLGGFAEKSAQARLRQLEQQAAELDRRLELAKSPGGRWEQVEALQEQIRRTRQAIDATKQQAEMERRMLPLLRPVSVELKDATVRQAAEVLSRASGVPIAVDEGVSTTTRLNVNARQIPLRQILHVIGRQTILQIAPTEKGIMLKPWPSLAVNDQVQHMTGPLAPWSDAWGSALLSSAALLREHQQGPPAPGVGISGPGGGLAAPGPFSPFPGTPGAAPAPRPPHPGGPGMGPFPAAGMPGQLPGGGAVALTSLGNNLVLLAEPGAGPQGEPGRWLTLYRLEGTRLVRLSSTFHRPGPPEPPRPAGPMARPPSAPPRPSRR